MSDLATRQYQHLLARTRQRTAAAAGAAWDSLGSYDLDDVDALVELVVPYVQAGQTHAAALTGAHMARRLGAPPLGIDPDRVIGPAARGGVLPEEVYRRPFVTVWSALASGTRWLDAVDQGRARLTSSVETDIALSTRESARQVFMDEDRVVGWRRVPDGGACEFCLLASTQRYGAEDLMPLHNHCGCTVEPIIGRRDPGHVIERDVLDALKVGDVDTARGIYADRVEVEEHGELGPVLTAAGEKFTDESDL